MSWVISYFLCLEIRITFSSELDICSVHLNVYNLNYKPSVNVIYCVSPYDRNKLSNVK